MSVFFTKFRLILNKKFNGFSRLSSLFYLLKTQFWYKFFFGKIGRKTRIFNPMFLYNPIGVSIGHSVFIRDYARIEVIGEGKISIGDHVSIEQGLHLVSAGQVNIGSNTTISFHVMITDVEHSYEEIGVDILKQSDRISQTYISDYCFIGAGARIQAGTTLGKQCIVGANSVVRGQFPDYCVIVGAPAKIVKRYDSAQKQWRKTDAIGNFL